MIFVFRIVILFSGYDREDGHGVRERWTGELWGLDWPLAASEGAISQTHEDRLLARGGDVHGKSYPGEV